MRESWYIKGLNRNCLIKICQSEVRFLDSSSINRSNTNRCDKIAWMSTLFVEYGMKAFKIKRAGLTVQSKETRSNIFKIFLVMQRGHFLGCLFGMCWWNRTQPLSCILSEVIIDKKLCFVYFNENIIYNSWKRKFLMKRVLLSKQISYLIADIVQRSGWLRWYLWWYFRVWP